MERPTWQELKVASGTTASKKLRPSTQQPTRNQSLPTAVGRIQPNSRGRDSTQQPWEGAWKWVICIVSSEMTRTLTIALTVA